MFTNSRSTTTSSSSKMSPSINVELVTSSYGHRSVKRPQFCTDERFSLVTVVVEKPSMCTACCLLIWKIISNFTPKLLSRPDQFRQNRPMYPATLANCPGWPCFCQSQQLPLQSMSSSLRLRTQHDPATRLHSWPTTDRQTCCSFTFPVPFEQPTKPYFQKD